MPNSSSHSSSSYLLSILTSFYPSENSSSNDESTASVMFLRYRLCQRAIVVEFSYCEPPTEFLYDAYRAIPPFFPRSDVMATEGVVPVTPSMPSFIIFEEVSRLSMTFCVPPSSSFRVPEDVK